LHWLADLDRDPRPLLEALADRHSSRLGLYFESLWKFYIEQHPDWELLGHNLQIGSAGRTRGAFDFLCRYRDEYWHLELAMKLYLGLKDSLDPGAWHQWWGPNCNDRLDIKLNHLTQRQLTLSTDPQGREALDTLV